MTESTTLNPELYPAKYRASIGAGLGNIIAMLGLLLLGISARTTLSLFSPMVLVTLGLVLLIGINAFFARIILYADRIECVTWFRKKTMLRSEVAGMRVLGRYKTPSLIYKNDADIPFSLPNGIKKDAAWDAWMAIAPDLDALDEKNILSDAVDYPHLGATEQERQRRWKRTNSFASVCKVSAIIALLIVFFPRIGPYGAGFLMALPWFVLVNMKLYGVCFPGDPRRTPLLGNSVALFASGMGLAIFGILYPIMSTAHGAAYGVAPILFPYGTPHILYLIAGPLCGLPLFIATLAMIFSVPQTKEVYTKTLIIMFLVPLLLLIDWGYGIGAALEINTIFDGSQPTTYVARVLSQPTVIKDGMRFEIGSWGNHQDVSVDVSGITFEYTAINDIICVWAHPGLLNIPWYAITLTTPPHYHSKPSDVIEAEKVCR